MRTRQPVAQIGLLALVAMGAACGLHGSVFADEYHGINAGAPVWGGWIYFTDARAQQIAATGCRAVRINFRMDWHQTWDSTILGIYDAIVQNALNHDLVVLGLLCNECMPVGQEAWNDDPDGDGMNQYVVDFSETALLLIDRYRTQIKRWEIWNEPNAHTNPEWQTDPQHAGGTYILPRVYANLLAETYKATNYREGRSLLSRYCIELCSGGLLAYDNMTGMNYMEQVYQQTAVWDWMEANVGRRYPWDLFGYHFYISQARSVSTYQLRSLFEGWPWSSDSVRQVQADYGDTARVLVTEFGWNTDRVSEATQRDNMRDTYEWLEGKSYVAGTYWYQWQDEPGFSWGITRSDGSHKLSYDEFDVQNGLPGPPVLPPAPVVLIVSDVFEVPYAEPVHFVPSVVLAPGAVAADSLWTLGADQLAVPGLPGEIEWIFPSLGDHDVCLAVTDCHGQTGVSNVITIRVTAPLYGKCDFDRDGDVDQIDFGRFQVCFSGSGIRQTAPECMAARLDDDGDVDALDFAIFSTCISGEAVPADPLCGHGF
ncbi:MAG TPA: hypothetical protein PLL20_20475 [Phycisphaerae bacterium]|nr:hypothetical protein [Phycisphaerae bacterium]HRR86719.1 hypothetical protein [Phycisphaerae bacterium]